MYQKIDTRPPSATPLTTTKKIVLLKKTSAPLATDRKNFSKTQQTFCFAKDPPAGIVKLRQTPARIPKGMVTPVQDKKVSPSVSQTQSTKSCIGENTPLKGKNEAELVDFLLQELAAVETELNESLLKSERAANDSRRTATPTIGFSTSKTPRAGFFKAALQSPAFTDEKEREAYLVKELEACFLSEYNLVTLPNRTRIKNWRFWSVKLSYCGKRMKA